MNASGPTFNELLGQAGLGSCNSCHLRTANKTQVSLKAPAVAAERVSGTLGPSRMQAGEGELTVSIVGLKSAEGQVQVALFDSEKAFLQIPFKAGVAAIEQSEGHWQVKGLQCGSYAVAIYHDRNNNGKLDRNILGIPVEPYGFSNNARGVLGPPSFSDARFDITGKGIRIEITLE